MARFYDAQGNFMIPRTNIPYDSQAAADNPSFYYRPETAAQNPMFYGGVMNQPVRTAMNQPPLSRPSMIENMNRQPPKKTGFINQIQSALKNPAVIDAAVMGLNAMRTRPDANIARQVQGRIDTRNQLGLIKAQRNKTAEFLRSKEREDLARTVETGGLDPKSAMALALNPTKQNDNTALMTNVAFLREANPELSVQEAIKMLSTQHINEGDKNRRAYNLRQAEKYYPLYQQTAIKSNKLAKDINQMTQLAELAPSGPIAGRIAEIFPSFSTAGAAFVALQKQLAPTMRAEGSGSTSDMEFNSMLEALPRLRNNQVSNQLIAEAFQNKANFDMKRAELVAQWQRRDITQDQLEMQIFNLETTAPILSPALQKLVDEVKAGQDNNADDDGEIVFIN